MWRRYKGRCLPACNALGEGFEDGFRAVGFGCPIRSPNCYDSCQLMNSSVSPGKTPFLYFESKYPALTRWPIFALRIDDGDTWHTPVYSTTMVSPPYFWLSSRRIVVVSASSSMSVISPVPNVMHDIGPPLVKPSSIGIRFAPVSSFAEVHPLIVDAITAAAASFTNVLLSIGVSPSAKVDLYDMQGFESFCKGKRETPLGLSQAKRSR